MISNKLRKSIHFKKLAVGFDWKISIGKHMPGSTIFYLVLCFMIRKNKKIWQATQLSAPLMSESHF